LQLFLELLALLLLTRIFGELAERIGQPASVGEILAGILLALSVVWLGPVLPFLSKMASSEVLEAVANLGIFFLVLSAGIEMEPREITESAKNSFGIALGGMIVPLAAGFALAWTFLPESDLRPLQSFLAGVALSISAIPATIKIFGDLGLLHTNVGKLVVSAAVFDDVLGLFLLAILLAVIETGQVPDILSFLLLAAKASFFFFVTVLLGAHVYPRVSRGVKAMQAAATEFSALAVVALAYGLLAEVLGMHWILGAFMAGLYFERTRVGSRAYNEIRLICNTLTKGVLGPLFFAYIGLRVDLTALTQAPLFLFLLISVAFFGKVAGAGLPARFAGLSNRDAAAVGIGMSARGAVELVVLSIAYEKGVFIAEEGNDSPAGHLFSSLVLMGVVTTMLAPILLRWLLKERARRT
jgi:Kef-type K+ transport system membrane component KefB